MRAAIRNLALAQALAVAFTFTVGAGYALADNANSKDEPTAEDLKNSKERNVILLPRVGTTSVSKPEVKPSHTDVEKTKASQAVKPVKKTASQNQAKTLPPAKSKVIMQAKSQPSDSAISTITPAGGINKNDSIINVWLDKKGSSPQYKHGDKMKINVSVTQDCNVMIFDFDGRGKLTQLYPNEYQQKTLLRAGDTITFGGADSPFDYQVSLPKGSNKAEERIFVYAYPLSEKPLSIALNTEDGTPFRSGEMTLAQYKKMVAESKVFFSSSNKSTKASTSTERDVKIVPKAGNTASSLKLVVDEEKGRPNKKEVSFIILGSQK